MPPCPAPNRPAPVAAHPRSATMLSPPEADLVRRDGVLPGLATVLDPDALLAALAPALPAADVRAASVRYVRYKPHTNCLVAYRLDVPGAESQTMDIHAKVHRLDAPEKLRKARQRAHAPGRLGVGRIVLEDRGLVVWAVSNDLRLRDRKSTRLNSSHGYISYAVFCLKKKKNKNLTSDTHTP